MVSGEPSNVETRQWSRKAVSESVSEGKGPIFSFHGSPQKCSLRKGQKYLVGMEIRCLFWACAGDAEAARKGSGRE